MKVLFVITKSNWGGAQRYVFDLAASLPRENYDVAVAVGGQGLLAERLKSAGIKVVGIPHLERDINFFKELYSTFYLWSIIQNERPDTIHLNSSKAGGLGAMAAYFLRLIDRRFRPMIIFTVHGWAFNERRNFIYQGLIYFLQWLTAFFSDKIVVLSRHDLRQAIEMPLIPNEKFVWIPLGVKEPDFIERTKAREILKIDPAEKMLIGTVAEFTLNKGLQYLVEGAKYLKESGNGKKVNFKIAIIGTGENFEKRKQQVAELGLENEVILCGFVADAVKYFKAFDIFILPSLKEGLPYTIIEAMHAGLPIVASSVGGLTDLIENEKNGILIPPKKPQEIADALKVLLKSRVMREKMGARSLELATQKFSFEKMLNGTIDVYEK